MRKFLVYDNNKARQLVNSIIATEGLEVTVRYFEDTLSDVFIEISGTNEEVELFKEIYHMVSGEEN